MYLPSGTLPHSGGTQKNIFKYTETKLAPICNRSGKYRGGHGFANVSYLLKYNPVSILCGYKLGLALIERNNLQTPASQPPKNHQILLFDEALLCFLMKNHRIL
jgi:hypothetical protein